MRDLLVRALAVPALAGLLLVACGGKTTGNGSPGGSSGGSSSSSGSSSSGGSSSSSGGIGSSGSSSGGSGACVLVDPSAYDRSCTTASDCAFIGSGEICDEQCSCAEALINSSGLARYQQAISSIDPATCFCGDPGEPACLGGQCVVESGVTVDAGPPDAGFCVDVDLSTYDTSCKADGDCINVTAGLICDGDCLCGGSAAINVDGQARYEATIAPVQQAACECPVSGAPRCIASQCTLCGPGTNPFHECPDGG